MTTSSKLRGYPFEFIAPNDLAIDWPNSKVKKATYTKDPIKNAHKLAFFEGVPPLTFICHHRKTQETLFAFGKAQLAQVDESEEIEYIGSEFDNKTGLNLGMVTVCQTLASLCIDDIQGLDVEKLKVEAHRGSRLKVLSEDAWGALGDGADEALETLGLIVLNGQSLGKPK